MMNKRHLLLVIRIAIAAAGLTYITLTLTWSDHVVAPEGTELPDHSTLQEPTALKVVEGELDSSNDAGSLRVLVPGNGKQATATMLVPRHRVGTDPNQFQPKPGIVTTIRRADAPKLLLGLLLLLPVYPIQAFRWWILMRSRGLKVTPWKSFRLVMLGCFFNYCMPGTTGGDVIKAYYTAKNSDRRADAVMSVVFDRIAGLAGLILLGGLAGLCMLHEPRARGVTAFIWSLAGVLTVGALVYFTPLLRRRLGVDWVLSRLPGTKILESIDRAAVAYRDHKREIAVAILMSICVHLFLMAATASAGFALGIRHPIGLLITVLPVLFFGAAVPISYQGLGIMEGLGIPLLVNPVLCTANQLIGMLLLIRLYMIAYALTGSLFLLRGDIHMHPQEQAEDSDARASIPATSSQVAASSG